MEGEDIAFNVAGKTILHPVGISVLLAMGVLTLVLPRKHALFPIIVISTLISSGQRIMIGPANFHFLRIMLLFATARMISRGEFSGIKVAKVDQLVIVFSIVKLVAYTLQWQTVASFIFQAGQSYDVLGTYFFFRCLVRTFDDLRGLGLSFALIGIPASGVFFIESMTGTNMFAVLGGVPYMTEVREGKIRCQGAFPHSIMAGVYFGSSVPFIAARWFDESQNKLLTLVGSGCFVVIAILTNCSTSIMALVFCAVGACFFPLRMKMRQVRWGLLFIMILAQFTLSGGVIYLISRVNILGGSTGWHRSYLMDRCIVYFPEWALLGTRDTAHWAEGTLGGVGLGDVTNQYIVEAVRGGFLAMMTFIAIIVLTYRNIGRMLRTREVLSSRAKTVYIYSLGVVLLVHTALFFSVSYFGQNFILIWLVFGITSGLSQTVLGNDQRSVRTTNRGNRLAVAG